jgi:excisionase family DNA binding protein
MLSSETLRYLLQLYNSLCHYRFMEDELLTVEEAAARLKMHVGTVRRLLREKTLPGVKMGPRQWRVPASALRDYINGQLGKPATSKKADA